jgi:hypothetical protein
MMVELIENGSKWVEMVELVELVERVLFLYANPSLHNTLLTRNCHDPS